MSEKKSMERHAYLVLVHKEPQQLADLISVLDNSRNDIFVHIDKKNLSEFENYKFIANYANLYIFSEYRVNWGGYSIVRTELFLLKEALKYSHEYYHLISGEDFPIKGNNEIFSFFDSCGLKEFILFNSENEDEDTLNRVLYYHFLREYCRISKVFWINQIIHLFEKSLIFLQKTLNIKRKKIYRNFRRGSQWVSITEDLACLVVSEEEKIEHDFRFTFAADEMIFQTVVINHPEYIDRLYCVNKYNQCDQNMRYIDWERGGPYLFRSKDFEDIISSTYLFVRKVDSTLVKMIKMRLDRENEKN